MLKDMKEIAQAFYDGKQDVLFVVKDNFFCETSQLNKSELIELCLKYANLLLEESESLVEEKKYEEIISQLDGGTISFETLRNTLEESTIFLVDVKKEPSRVV